MYSHFSCTPFRATVFLACSHALDLQRHPQCPLCVYVFACGAWTPREACWEVFLLIALLQSREPLSTSPLSFPQFFPAILSFPRFSLFPSSPALPCSTASIHNSSIALVKDYLEERSTDSRAKLVHEADSSNRPRGLPYELQRNRFIDAESGVCMCTRRFTCVNEYLLVWLEAAD